jgi:hypothetical protein
MSTTNTNQPAATMTGDVKTTVQQTLQQGSATIATQVPQQFATMAAVRQARVNLLQRQATSLAAQSDAKPEAVTAVQTSIQANKLSIAKFGAVSDQASTPVPSIPANGWVLHGRVRDAQLQPVPKFTALLTDQEKTWQRQYGYAFTDASGYFSVAYAPPASAEPAAASPPTSAETARAAAAVSLYLQVLNGAGDPVYFDSQAITLVPGVSPYRDIVLPDTEPLGSPPGGAFHLSPPLG